MTAIPKIVKIVFESLYFSVHNTEFNTMHGVVTDKTRDVSLLFVFKSKIFTRYNKKPKPINTNNTTICPIITFISIRSPFYQKKGL